MYKVKHANENCYKISSILIIVCFCFTGTDDTFTPRKTESDNEVEVREEIIRRLNEESEKEVKKIKIQAILSYQQKYASHLI